MFEYAITRTVAERNGYKFGFNPTPSNDYLNGQIQMDFLDIDYGKVHNAGWKELPKGITEIWNEPVIVKHDDGGDYNYYPYSPEVFDVKDNTKLVTSCCQTPKYFDREKLLKWFSYKDSKELEYAFQLDNWGINIADPNLCVLNMRGRFEYLNWNILLPREYWRDAISLMKRINPNVKFIIISDDPLYFEKQIGIPAYHFSIGCDYFCVNNAKNLIISNSSFGIFPTWLNEHHPNVVAPKYWARWNFSTGDWGWTDTIFPEWNYMDREGKEWNETK